MLTGFPFAKPSEYAEESPTVELLQYLVEKANAHGKASPRSIRQANFLIAFAGRNMGDDGIDNEDNKRVYDCADAIIVRLTALIDLPTSLHSLVINWSDREADQGTFGTTVRAWDHAHAEYLARYEMEHNDCHGDDYSGTVVDHNKGATWLAAELETALRDLTAWAELMRVPGAEAPPQIDAANKLLAQIDKLA